MVAQGTHTVPAAVPAAVHQVALPATEKFIIEAHPAADLQELEFTTTTAVLLVDLRAVALATSSPKQWFPRQKHQQELKLVCSETVT